ncbi:hypothetical protein BJY01DRAFT_245672 [Aspergillus pseudoustus]|uniref:P-loop containing nucleoside triphosphate hydrolase protein n=1 Tax=Aspergillus pseudoustus TaxID=1810923 RepID=A0ABR4KD43_9EURO
MAEKFFYGYSNPPAHVRTKPLRVICVGLPRSATESLSIALQKLGYRTFHGWDLMAQSGAELEGWTKLAARKYSTRTRFKACGKNTDNESNNNEKQSDKNLLITTEEFDALLGDHDAIIDSAASIFCPEIVAAYPDAKVILNSRTDLAAWQRSVIKTIVPLQESWFIWLVRWFGAEGWWLWQFYMRYGYPGLFRGRDNWGVRGAVVQRGQWVYRDHCNMVRGMMAGRGDASAGAGQFLEWSVEQGWGPLCEFLERPVPDEAFPRSNDARGFEANIERLLKKRILLALRNMVLVLAVGGGVTAAAWMKWQAS